MNCSKWLLLCVCYLQMRSRRSSRGRGRGRRRSESPSVGERARPRSRSPSQLEAVVRRRTRAGRSVPAASRVASAAPANTRVREVSPPPTFDSSSPLHADVETPVVLPQYRLRVTGSQVQAIGSLGQLTHPIPCLLPNRHTLYTVSPCLLRPCLTSIFPNHPFLIKRTPTMVLVIISQIRQQPT